MNKRPPDTSAEEPDGGNPHIRSGKGPDGATSPGYSTERRWHRDRMKYKGGRNASSSVKGWQP